MKINLERIRYKNFLSVGAAPVEIDSLSQYHTTLITGTNGASKSTMMDALMFALYGRSYRDINKNQLINSINKKNCQVELWFNIDNKTEYYIKRGIKPNIFIIEEDGVLIEEQAGVLDYQKILETKILKMTYKTAKQIVALGTAGFTPFMQLKPHERRTIIDDLLDIEVFTLMGENNKKQLDVLSTELDKTSSDITFNEREIAIRKKHITENKLDKTTLIISTQGSIDFCNRTIIELNEKIEKCLADVEKLNAAITPFSKEEASAALTAKTTFTHEAKNIEKGIRFFADHCKCPTCKQAIDKTFIEQKIAQYTKELEDATNSLRETEAKIAKYEQIKLRNSKIDQKKQSINEQIVSHNHHIATARDNIRRLGAELETAKAAHAEIDVNTLKTLVVTTKDLAKNKTILSNKKNVHTLATSLLKDNAIKARIISQYIPVINQLINNYLGIMDANYKFELDSEFNEKILSRGREEFSYMSFSQGEKMRIDLAILFTWRELIKLKNSASFNLLIMDEILDSAADQEGIDSILKIIADLKDNVYIISHNEKIDPSSFDHHIQMVKIGNFSSIDKSNV